MLSAHQQCDHQLLEIQILGLYTRGAESEILGVDQVIYALVSHPGDSDTEGGLRINALYTIIYLEENPYPLFTMYKCIYYIVLFCPLNNLCVTSTLLI